MANPTAQKVLDEFGIAVTGLDGKARSLTHILKDLKSAMMGLPETEQLANIQNLVGVYAASPIAALINQVDNMADLEHLLNNSANAASRMRMELEKALKFDYKQALSAFQEVQLQIFEVIKDRLQKVTIDTASWLSSFSMPFNGDEDVTKLEVYLDRMGTLSAVIGSAGAAMLALKTTSQNGILTRFHGSLAGVQTSLKGLLVGDAKVSYSFRSIS